MSSQRDVTIENLENVIEGFNELFETLPKSKKMQYIGHANDFYLFMAGVKELIEGGQDV